MLEAGSVVRGNWSQISYRVDHAWHPCGESYWCINGKAVDNPSSSGSFNHLGKRVGNWIEVGGPHSAGDKLFVVSEPGHKRVKLPVGQLELGI